MNTIFHSVDEKQQKRLRRKKEKEGEENVIDTNSYTTGIRLITTEHDLWAIIRHSGLYKDMRYCLKCRA